MSYTLNLGTNESDQSKPFGNLLSEVDRISADTEKLQHIHQNVCSELAYRLSVSDTYPSPNYHGLSNLELLKILRSVFKKMMDISSRERTLLHQAHEMNESLTRALEPDEETRNERFYGAGDEYRDRMAEFAWEDDMLEHADPVTADSYDEEY